MTHRADVLRDTTADAPAYDVTRDVAGKVEPESFKWKSTLDALADLLPRLDAIASVVELQLEQSSVVQSLLRGKANDLLQSGTVQLAGGVGAWRAQFDFTVPFARVGWVDSAVAGPFTFDTSGTGAVLGPGVFNTFAGGGDSGVVPLLGRHLTISSTSASATPPTLFLAIFATPGELVVM